MYISPIIVGVVGTLVIEFAALLIAFFMNERKNDENDNDKSDK
mgnify:CR=1 FL=1